MTKSIKRHKINSPDMSAKSPSSVVTQERAIGRIFSETILIFLSARGNGSEIPAYRGRIIQREALKGKLSSDATPLGILYFIGYLEGTNFSIQ